MGWVHHVRFRAVKRSPPRNPVPRRRRPLSWLRHAKSREQPPTPGLALRPPASPIPTVDTLLYRSCAPSVFDLSIDTLVQAMTAESDMRDMLESIRYVANKAKPKGTRGKGGGGRGGRGGGRTYNIEDDL